VYSSRRGFNTLTVGYTATVTEQVKNGWGYVNPDSTKSWRSTASVDVRQAEVSSEYDLAN